MKTRLEESLFNLITWLFKEEERVALATGLEVDYRGLHGDNKILQLVQLCKSKDKIHDLRDQTYNSLRTTLNLPKRLAEHFNEVELKQPQISETWADV